MTISQAITVAAAATMLLSVLAPAQDQEKKVKRSDLPPAVEKAVSSRAKGNHSPLSLPIGQRFCSFVEAHVRSADEVRFELVVEHRSGRHLGWVHNINDLFACEQNQVFLIASEGSE
jgi:hypothetical protein